MLEILSNFLKTPKPFFNKSSSFANQMLQEKSLTEPLCLTLSCFQHIITSCFVFISQSSWSLAKTLCPQQGMKQHYARLLNHISAQPIKQWDRQIGAQITPRRTHSGLLNKCGPSYYYITLLTQLP